MVRGVKESKLIAGEAINHIKKVELNGVKKIKIVWFNLELIFKNWWKGIKKKTGKEKLKLH